jgi:hypothetical protein
LNVAFGYFYCYIFLAGFLGFAMLFTFFVLPNSLNQTSGEDIDETDEQKSQRLEAQREYDEISKQVSQ